MPTPPHKHRARAVQLMSAGLATPAEIAFAMGLSIRLVRSWRYRAKIDCQNKRMVRVQRLMWQGMRNDGQD
jgi:DNA-binding CsgD family transcriptional regulator